ncbi:1-aminocyclopropane-1-carboxylate synthase-like protein 1 [Colletotrichum tanaceti]|uniref:1-aminocyclopropane-1-carboxylate synthase-like protein 1 n=1 Tax=Colletotrichum tanaceti TaxID=1306861 RepID=A0A4U6XHZ9_9PEZI|nr:1-aminocyclopropane-1-carboxylate synthase-like protein 1 [Colletotrichum tanaceti]TKW55153.1 1-aminocyclopropane-1-carboxylate synthase-like protein 1 [Colletotrichum tanaceti]
MTCTTSPGGAMLSPRAAKTASALRRPWRFAPAQTYSASNPSGVISLASASNALMLDDVASFAARVPLPPDVFTYAYSTAGGARLRAAVASHLNLTFGPHAPLAPGDVQVASGATAVQSVLAFALASAGEGVLASRPVYGRFELDFGNEMGVEVVYADNATPEACLEPGVVGAFEAALRRSRARGVPVRAVIIVNPNNPLGRCYPRETLVAIMRFCQSHRIHLISDEIYGLSVFSTSSSSSSSSEPLPTFTSVLSIDPEGIIDPDLVHVEYGLAKDFAASGMRLGVLVSRNRALHDAFSSVVRFHSPAGPSVAIAAAMLEDREWHDGFVSGSREKLAAAYEFATKGLEDLGVRYVRANAGFFVYVDLSPWLPPPPPPPLPPSPPREERYATDQEREFALAEKILEAGVFLHPCEEHCLAPGWFRVVYTQSQDIIGEGLKR